MTDEEHEQEIEILEEDPIDEEESSIWFEDTSEGGAWEGYFPIYVAKRLYGAKCKVCHHIFKNTSTKRLIQHTGSCSGSGTTPKVEKLVKVSPSPVVEVEEVVMTSEVSMKNAEWTGFSRVIENGKLVGAKCDSCSKLLKNTAIKRLELHRSNCTGEHSYIKRAPPTKSESGRHPGESEEMSYSSRLQYDEAWSGFSRYMVNDRLAGAKCNSCGKVLKNTSVKRLIAHSSTCFGAVFEEADGDECDIQERFQTAWNEFSRHVVDGRVVGAKCKACSTIIKQTGLAKLEGHIRSCSGETKADDAAAAEEIDEHESAEGDVNTTQNRLTEIISKGLSACDLPSSLMEHPKLAEMLKELSLEVEGKRRIA